MKVFDYAAAWHGLAIPAYNTLPEEVKSLYRVTAEKSRGLTQLQDLSMPWPDGLREDFRAFNTATLASASRAVYFCGHWKPSREFFLGAEHGAHWKFSSYADTTLAERLGLNPPHARTDGNAKFVRIHEGYIRVCFSSPWSWRWEEVGPASAELVSACRAIPYVSAGRHGRADYDAAIDAGIARALALRDAADRWTAAPRGSHPRSHDEFMREECTDKYCHDASLPNDTVCARHTPEANAKREHDAAVSEYERACARLARAKGAL